MKKNNLTARCCLEHASPREWYSLFNHLYVKNVQNINVLSHTGLNQYSLSHRPVKEMHWNHQIRFLWGVVGHDFSAAPRNKKYSVIIRETELPDLNKYYLCHERLNVCRQRESRRGCVTLLCAASRWHPKAISMERVDSGTIRATRKRCVL